MKKYGCVFRSSPKRPQRSSFELCKSVKQKCVTVYDYEGEWNRRNVRAVELSWRRGAVSQLPEAASAVMGVTSRIGAIKVWILTAHKAAVLVMLMKESRRQLIPCVSHDSLDGSFGDRTALAAQLLPIVEQRVVQWRKALGSIGRHE